MSMYNKLMLYKINDEYWAGFKYYYIGRQGFQWVAFNHKFKILILSKNEGIFTSTLSETEILNLELIINLVVQNKDWNLLNNISLDIVEGNPTLDKLVLMDTAILAVDNAKGYPLDAKQFLDWFLCKEPNLGETIITDPDLLAF